MAVILCGHFAILVVVRRFHDLQSKMESKNKTIPTSYPELNTVLDAMVDSVQAILGTNFVGAYLQGSFAVGDFDLHSDVDFIIVIAEELSNNQVDALQVMHEHIYALESPWAKHLE